MRFGALRRHWEQFGRRDPYWAVLTDPQKRGRQWDIGEFFASGDIEIDAVLGRAGTLGLAPSRRRALDFGCGAGRLTQAMATHFAACDGVDISASMLRTARQHDRHPDRCTYHLNARPDLSLFADGSFDFAYSTLVLQHMEPRYSKRYIEELLRVLAPGGLLVFQLPSQRSIEASPRDARHTAVRGPLPPAACRARLTAVPATAALAPGQQLTLEVTVENQSPYPWPALADARGLYQIGVANHWLYDDGEMARRDDARCPLPFDLAPGSRTTVMLVVTAPPADGAFLLELDLVQEDVGWFAGAGSATLRLPIVIGAGGVRPRRPPEAAPAAPPPTFSHRHPGAFRLLRATGVRDAYWAWRRAVDRVKTVRDTAIVGVRTHPQFVRLVNWWRRGPFSPVMEMHCVSRAEVTAIVAAAGGRIVDVEEERTPGFVSCRYWVTRP